MTESTQDMMLRMKAERSAQAKGKKKSVVTNVDDFYSHMAISKQKRHGLRIGLIVFFFIFLSLLYNNSILGGSWLLILSPILLFGGLICVLPPTEDWVYRPWQAKAQQYERFISGQ